MHGMRSGRGMAAEGRASSISYIKQRSEKEMKAQDILEAAAGHMKDRAATYDKPEGERSMGATVEAFKAVTGHDLTEEQGWLFMALLKAVRSQQGAYRSDSYEDGAAYFALAGESAARDRKQPIKRELYGVTSQEKAAAMAAAWKEGESERGEKVDGGGWIEWAGGECPVDTETMVEVESEGGEVQTALAGWYEWGHFNADGDIIRYRVI